MLLGNGLKDDKWKSDSKAGIEPPISVTPVKCSTYELLELTVELGRSGPR